MSDQEKNPEKEVKEKKVEKKIWHPQQEKILKEWAEIASSYRYLHDRAFAKFTSQNMWYSLPVILLSTITGTANFAQASMPAEAKQYAPLVIGSANLIAGMITTVAQFLRVSELMEGHRVASIAFGRFSRNIAVELSLPTQERSDSGTPFLNECRTEINKLLEQSPMIPIDIVREFAKKFSHKIKCKKAIKRPHHHHKEEEEEDYKTCCGLICCAKKKKKGKKGKTVSDFSDDNSSDVLLDDQIECHCVKCTQFTKPEILEIKPVDIYQPTREERVAEATARAAIRMKELMEEKEREQKNKDKEDDYKKEPTALDIINGLHNFRPFSLDNPATPKKKSKSLNEMVGRYKEAYNSDEFMARYNNDAQDIEEEDNRDSTKQSFDDNGGESGDESGRDSGDDSGRDSGDDSGRESGRDSGDESEDDKEKIEVVVSDK